MAWPEPRPWAGTEFAAPKGGATDPLARARIPRLGPDLRASSPLTRLSRQKYDYDSSSVRKRFFREALLQITIPFLLKKLAPTCKSVRVPLAPPHPLRQPLPPA